MSNFNNQISELSKQTSHLVNDVLADVRKVSDHVNNYLPKGVPKSRESVTTVSSTGGTFSADAIVGGIINYTAGAGSTATDTAANIIAAEYKAVTGDVSKVLLVNSGAGTLTVTAGTGVTLVPSTFTLATLTSRTLWVRVASSSTVVIYG